MINIFFYIIIAKEKTCFHICACHIHRCWHICNLPLAANNISQEYILYILFIIVNIVVPQHSIISVSLQMELKQQWCNRLEKCAHYIKCIQALTTEITTANVTWISCKLQITDLYPSQGKTKHTCPRHTFKASVPSIRLMRRKKYENICHCHVMFQVEVKQVNIVLLINRCIPGMHACNVPVYIKEILSIKFMNVCFSFKTNTMNMAAALTSTFCLHKINYDSFE